MFNDLLEWFRLIGEDDTLHLAYDTGFITSSLLAIFCIFIQYLMENGIYPKWFISLLKKLKRQDLSGAGKGPHD
jgi:hypothetical protein